MPLLRYKTHVVAIALVCVRELSHAVSRTLLPLLSALAMAQSVQCDL